MNRIPKINSIHYGGVWIGLSVFIGIILPLIIKLFTHRFFWCFCVLGGGILLTFILLFSIEMHQDFGKVPYYEKKLKEQFSFDPQQQYAVIRSSICTGEKVAGFKNVSDGHFVEVMVIRSDAELERFKKTFDIETIKTEY